MSQWPSSKAKRVFSALIRLGWQLKRQTGSHRTLSREGWADVPAVQSARLHEIKSCDILQPGPAALTDGVEQLHRLFANWAVAS